MSGKACNRNIFLRWLTDGSINKGNCKRLLTNILWYFGKHGKDIKLSFVNCGSRKMTFITVWIKNIIGIKKRLLSGFDNHFLIQHINFGFLYDPILF